MARSNADFFFSESGLVQANEPVGDRSHTDPLSCARGLTVSSQLQPTT